MPRTASHLHVHQRFQSAPGREAGRCTASYSLHGTQFGFNPRPAVRPGDALRGVSVTELFRFQSAPGREAGRCEALRLATDRVEQFQSAPGREAGRCSASAALVPPPGSFQSAPGREAGRCAQGLQRQRRRFSRFNPRPAVRPGDAGIVGANQRRGARGFNPRPAVRPGDAFDTIGDHGTTDAFQSAPGREAGRCAAGHSCRRRCRVSIRARP